MKVPDYLKEHVRKGLIRVQHHPDLPLLVCNYTPVVQYDRKWDSITMTHRGKVVDFDGEVVSYCLPKFFNYQEHLTVPGLPVIPMTGVQTVQEKIDGSYIAVRNHPEYGLIVSSRGSFTSDHAGWARQIIDSWDNVKFDPSLTYIFELIHPEARIVVDYGQRQELVLLTAFYSLGHEVMDTSQLTEIPESVARRPQQYDISGNDIEELLKEEKENFEGYVVKYKNDLRVKVKLEEYVRIHSIVTGLTPRKVFDAVKDNTIEQIIDMIPDESYPWISDLSTMISQRGIELLEQGRDLAQEGLQKHGEDRKALAQHFLGHPDLSHAAPIAFRFLDDKDPEEAVWKQLRKSFDDWPETKRALGQSFAGKVEDQ